MCVECIKVAHNLVHWQDINNNESFGFTEVVNVINCCREICFS